MYQYRDMKRHKCHFCLAFCSVFTIVLSTLIVTSIIGKGPVIFLKMAEANNGEIDAVITPAGITADDPHKNEIFLNYTKIL
jgi:hypothetical protein